MEEKQKVIEAIEKVMSQNYGDPWVIYTLAEVLESVKDPSATMTLQELNQYLLDTFGMYYTFGV